MAMQVSGPDFLLSIFTREEYLSSHPWVTRVRGPRSYKCQHVKTAGEIEQCGNNAQYVYTVQSGAQLKWCSVHLAKELEVNTETMNYRKANRQHHRWVENMFVPSERMKTEFSDWEDSNQNG